MITRSDMANMYERALVNRGNQSRLKRVLNKAEEENRITIGFVGGSITMGCSAVPMEENCYAALVASWFYDTFGEENVRYVNAGIGATDSYLGVHRVERDLLVEEPDLVVIEFSVNDERALNEESYDSLVRKIYNSKSEPAVLLLFLTQRDGSDDQAVHERIGAYYDLPMISYRNAVLPLIKENRLPWNLIANEEDGTHPANLGHFIIGSLLVHYLEDAYWHRVEEEEEAPLKDPYTKDIYHNATMYDHTNLLPTEATDFEPVMVREAQFKNGWKTTKGGSIAFYLTGKNLGIIYYGTKDGLSGTFDVFVDGRKVTTLNADFIGKWGSFADYKELVREEQVGLHKVEIRKAADSLESQFIVLGFTVS